MIKFLKYKLAACSLARKQHEVARELQAVFDTRAALIQHEAYLMRYSAHLAVKELDLNVTSRCNQVVA